MKKLLGGGENLLKFPRAPLPGQYIIDDVLAYLPVGPCLWYGYGESGVTYRRILLPTHRKAMSVRVDTLLRPNTILLFHAFHRVDTLSRGGGRRQLMTASPPCDVSL